MRYCASRALDPDSRDRLHRDVFALALNTPIDAGRPYALRVLSQEVQPPVLHRVVAAAVETARSPEAPGVLYWSLIQAAAFASPLQRVALLEEALRHARSVRKPYERAFALASVATAVPAADRSAVLREAVTVESTLAEVEATNAERLALRVAKLIPPPALARTATIVAEVRRENGRPYGLEEIIRLVPRQTVMDGLTALGAELAPYPRQQVLAALRST